MPTSQDHVSSDTPMGASLVGGGATFRVWAPRASAIYVILDSRDPAPELRDAQLLVRGTNGYWAGFLPGVADGTRYRFWVVGDAGAGYKRDPYARELELHGYPDCNCIVRDPSTFPWSDQGFRPAAFNDLVVYQLHIGVFSARDAAGNDIRPGRAAKFLDLLERIPYLQDLGVNAVMPLPFVEFQGPHSRGYNGTDLFSPEMDYAVDPADLDRYVAMVSRVRAARGRPSLAREHLAGQVNQLKALVDTAHAHGLAVLTDVVYNHAGPGFDDQSLASFDRSASWDDLYLGSEGHAGGRVFAYRKPEVRQFLIDNANLFLREYHVDGIRYDEVTVIDEHGGWSFCQDLTGTAKYVNASAVHIAEYWGNERWRGVVGPPWGMGFDAGYGDRLRDCLRGAVAQAAWGRGARVDLDEVRDALHEWYWFPAAWKVLQNIENHDLVDAAPGHGRGPRIPALADSSNPRSWYARSRARVATGLLMTAPGIPMIFMGQEFLEDKPWSDDFDATNRMIWWQGLEGRSKDMSDHHRFTRDLLWLRRKHPALRGDHLNVFHVHVDNRVIAFHRWLEGVGRDVVVVASLNESAFYDRSYRIGFPGDGHWNEVFNSDIYDQFANPIAQGNYGGVDAYGPGMHGMPASAGITVPANGLLVFARDLGDP